MEDCLELNQSFISHYIVKNGLVTNFTGFAVVWASEPVQESVLW